MYYNEQAYMPLGHCGTGHAHLHIVFLFAAETLKEVTQSAVHQAC